MASVEADSLRIGRLRIPLEEVVLTVTTSGGPGGQHANRAATKVTASFDVAASAVLGPIQKERLVGRCGAVVRATSSKSRSQAQNRAAALAVLADRLEAGLAVAATRRATRPSRSSQARRVDEKQHRGSIKATRRRPNLED